MWEHLGRTKTKEKEPLEAFCQRVFCDARREQEAQAVIASVQSDPAIREMLACPQTPPEHLEGPTVLHHIRAMLMGLAVVVEDREDLSRIEELAPRGFEAEVREVGQVMREHAATLRAFCLLHDLGKPRVLQFVTRRNVHAEHPAILEGGNPRIAFESLWTSYRSQQAEVSTEEAMIGFYTSYGIEATYPAAAHQIFAPMFESSVRLVAQQQRLSASELGRLLVLIELHETIRAHAAEHRHDVIGLVRHLAQQRGQDASVLLDLVEATVLLEDAFGRLRLGLSGAHHDASAFAHVLTDRRRADPERAEALTQTQGRRSKQERQAWLRQMHLDGNALKPIFSGLSGPQFGAMLARVQETAFGQRPLWELADEIPRELVERVQKAREHVKVGAL